MPKKATPSSSSRKSTKKVLVSDYFDEMLQVDVPKKASIKKTKSRTKKSKSSSKKSIKPKVHKFNLFITYTVIGLLLLGSFIILTPNPINSLVFPGQETSDVASGKDLGLPEVCSILDPITSTEILGQEPLPYIETNPSTSTVICSYANKTKDKGVALIARTFSSRVMASQYVGEIEATKEDTAFIESINQVDVLLEKGVAYIQREEIVYIVQYSGFEELPFSKMRVDIAKIIDNL